MEPRRRALKGGRIICPGNTTTYDCRVRDISENGARLEIDQWYSFPRNIILEIGRSELIESRYECEVRWNSDKQLGVKFVNKLPLEGGPPPSNPVSKDNIAPIDFDAVRSALRKHLPS